MKTQHLTTATGVQAVVDVINSYDVQLGVDGLELATPDLSSFIFDGIQIPERLEQYLGDLRVLRHIPLGYLVPDPDLLPPESIRFFHVNQTWVDRVIDGVFSTTNLGTVDFHYGLSMLQKIRDAVEVAPNGMTGLLIRSELVRRWPKMIVEGFANHDGPLEDDPSQLPTLRAEPISRDVFIALFDGRPKRVQIREPFQGVRFGVEGDSFPYEVDRRGTNGQLLPGNIEVTARNTSRRTLHLGDLRDKLTPDSMGDPRGVALALEQRPFVQLFYDDVSEGEGSKVPPVDLNVALHNGKLFTLSFAQQALFHVVD